VTPSRPAAWRNVYFYPEITENVMIESRRVWLGDSRENGKKLPGISPIARLLGTDWRFDLTVSCNRREEVAVCIVTRDGQ
jgi:hypothetical protein